MSTLEAFQFHFQKLKRASVHFLKNNFQQPFFPTRVSNSPVLYFKVSHQKQITAKQINPNEATIPPV